MQFIKIEGLIVFIFLAFVSGAILRFAYVDGKEVWIYTAIYACDGDTTKEIIGEYHSRCALEAAIKVEHSTLMEGCEVIDEIDYCKE